MLRMLVQRSLRDALLGQDADCAEVDLIVSFSTSRPAQRGVLVVLSSTL